MRKFFLGCLALAFSGLVACSDLPTAPRSPEAEAQLSTGLMGCPRGPGGENCYTLPPVSGGPTIPACDPWMDANWCKGDQCIMGVPAMNGPEFSGIASCPIGGGPIGGPGGPGTGGPGTGGQNPPPTVPTDTCNTGDPAFDDPTVKQGFKDLWNRSNPDAPQAQRLEQGAWIVQDANGSFRMAPFTITSQGPCNINGNFNAPAGAVAWVHTHPFRTGEIQTICGALKQPDPSAPGGYRDVIGPNGQPVYPQYRNKPSIPDHELMNDVNTTMAMLGRGQLAGVIIDANRTTVYTENPADGTTSFPRCGY